jgi:hypothetical protein
MAPRSKLHVLKSSGSSPRFCQMKSLVIIRSILIKVGHRLVITDHVPAGNRPFSGNARTPACFLLNQKRPGLQKKKIGLSIAAEPGEFETVRDVVCCLRNISDRRRNTE